MVIVQVPEHSNTPAVRLNVLVVPLVKSRAGIWAVVADPLRFENDGWALEIIPRALIAVMKLFDAPVSALTIVKALPLESRQIWVFDVESK